MLNLAASQTMKIGLHTIPNKKAGSADPTKKVFFLRNTMKKCFKCWLVSLELDKHAKVLKIVVTTSLNFQLTFTCSKSTIETLEKDVKCVFLLTLNSFHTFF